MNNNISKKVFKVYINIELKKEDVEKYSNTKFSDEIWNSFINKYKNNGYGDDSTIIMDIVNNLEDYMEERGFLKKK